MEAVFAPYSSADQPIPPYNKQQQTKNPSKRNHSNKNFSNSRSTENLAPVLNNNNIHGSFFFAPPPLHSLSLSYSYPPYNNTSIPYYPNQVLQRQISQQPPLLPIPISTQSSLPVTRTRSDLSCPPPTRKTNRNINKDNSISVTPRKSKQPIKKQDSKTALVNINPSKANTTVPSVPEPNDLPKNVLSPAPRSLSSSFITGNGAVNNYSCSNIGAKDLERFTGSIFTLSPPPSSLPLPKFSIRRKALSCTAEAAGNVDAGATDNLRRILRL